MNRKIVISILLGCVFALLFSDLNAGIAEGAGSTNAAGLSREIVADFIGVVTETRQARPRVSLSREIAANFIGTLKANPPTQAPAGMNLFKERKK